MNSNDSCLGRVYPESLLLRKSRHKGLDKTAKGIIGGLPACNLTRQDIAAIPTTVGNDGDSLLNRSISTVSSISTHGSYYYCDMKPPLIYLYCHAMHI